jgi:cell division transport system permease protein
MEKIRYFLKEGFRNVWVNRLMSLASVSVLIVCLILLGTSLLVSYNIKALIGQIEDNNQIMVYLKKGTSQADVTAVGDRIRDLGNVKKVAFISKQQALSIQKQQLGKDADLLEGLDKDNPLPDTYQVQLRDMSRYAETVGDLTRIKGVDNVKEHVELAQKLANINHVVNLAALWLVLILAVVSLFIIANTIKAAMYVRKREINIMKFVGATDGFIRWPFVVEGVILGITSGVLALFIQWYLYNRLISSVVGVLGIVRPLEFSRVSSVAALGFILLGIFVGVCGSLVSIRKYLKV